MIAYQTEYFAYGSNMSLPHLREWLRRSGVQPDEVSNPRLAILPRFRIRTNYLTTTGLAAANIEPFPEEHIEGVLLAISTEAHKRLRMKEGNPHRYGEIEVEVIMPSSGERIQAFTYAVTINHRLPFDLPVSEGYRKLVLDGAQQAKLSRVYQTRLKTLMKTPKMMHRELLSSIICDSKS